ncbi:acetyl-CoA synthetase-like protein [Marasmius fiardii PR-910]|nr:acetyl-CoA synthetase-like protein [Marasmius fiardii PR-910]
MTDWEPKRTVEECDRIICAPGNPHELERRVIDGRVQRVYKNCWISLREFWLWACNEHKENTFVVYESRRYSYAETLARAAKVAHIFRTVYGIEKGDRVSICSRNYPEYMVAFWACHLIGAVSVLLNAWLPQDGLVFCIARTQTKLLILDPERADVLASAVKDLFKNGTKAILVLESGKKTWSNMSNWDETLEWHKSDGSGILREDVKILPEDNATIFFTSGTTGRPKGVLSTQRQFLTNILNVGIAPMRDTLRRGEDIVPPEPGPQKGILISVPLFHVTGLSSHSMLAAFVGYKIVLMRRWSAREVDRLINAENVVSAGGVPSMVADLLEIGGFSVEALSFGGAPASKMLPSAIRAKFPEARAGQGYGATETNSIAVSLAGEDQVLRPMSCGLPTPVNDLLIVDPQSAVAVPAGQVGEVWIRGPNVMQEYWGDPEATNKAITKDGWFRTGDLGYLDEEGFLFIKDRLKDIIIRGGENIDSVSVENALYEEPGVLEAAAIGVPDPRLGELVAAVVTIKPNYEGKVTEKSLIELTRGKLPRFAVPAMVIVQTTEMEHTPSGKIVKGTLRTLAREEWERRKAGTTKSKL